MSPKMGIADAHSNIGYDEENLEYDILEEVMEEIAEEEYMDEDAHKGFLISDESDINDPGSDT